MPIIHTSEEHSAALFSGAALAVSESIREEFISNPAEGGATVIYQQRPHHPTSQHTKNNKKKHLFETLDTKTELPVG